MKNVHIIPTDKPSRLYYNSKERTYQLCEFPKYHTDIKSTHNLYITSDEDIKDCWVLNTHTNEVYFLDAYYGIQQITKKIILTTDLRLAPDVQKIDDEFLEWFVKNPSCDEVEVVEELKYFDIDELRERNIKGLPHIYSEKIGYKIIIDSLKRFWINYYKI
jgi:hypothetical protein